MMTPAFWQCPDPQCGGLLNRHKSKRVAIDPRTDKEVGPVLTWGWIQVYEDPWSGVGYVLAFLLWIGVGYAILALFPGRASHSPLAIILSALGFVAGLVGSFAWYKLFEKRREAALARAVWYQSYRCQRCRKRWLFPEADHPEALSAEGGRQTEERHVG